MSLPTRFKRMLTVALLLPVVSASANLPEATPPGPVAYSLEEFRTALRSGGPGKDGIPAIDQPRFQPAAQADNELDDRDIVIGVYRNGEARAYPQRILVWHEIVNDRIGGEAVSLTYCPLTGTALGFERGNTQLGVSGKLVNSNLVMYDRASDSEWPQILGVAITREALRRDRLIETRLGNHDVVVIHDPGLDTGWAFRNPQAVEIDITRLSFGPEGISGPGIDRMEPVNAFEAMWFAWAAFYPDTDIHE